MGRKELVKCFEDTLMYSNTQLEEQTRQSILSNSVYYEGFETKKGKKQIKMVMFPLLN